MKTIINWIEGPPVCPDVGSKWFLILKNVNIISAEYKFKYFDSILYFNGYDCFREEEIFYHAKWEPPVKEEKCKHAEKQYGKCMGYQIGENDDEPAEMCKYCADSLFYNYDEDIDFEHESMFDLEKKEE